MNNKIKILYISHSPSVNGAEMVLLNILKNINRELFEPFVIFPGNGPLLEEVRKLGIKTFVIDIERWIRFKFDTPCKKSTIQDRVRSIEKIIEENSIDIVHTNTSVIIEGAIAAKLKGKPHLWHIHEFLPKYTELQSFIPYSIVYRIIDYLSYCIISVSEYASTQFKGHVEDSKLKIIYNGVNENRIDSTGTDISIRPIVETSDKEINVVTIGFLTENKGYKELLEAVSIIKSKRNSLNVKFTWVGNASRTDLKLFRKLVRKLNIGNSIEYKGFSTDIQRILSNSDILLCPSRNEAFPMVIIEAMASRLPVIATSCGGTNESVVNNETGFIVPVNDPFEMSNKIIDLCSDEELRARFSKNSFASFKSKFDIKNIVKEIEITYQTICLQQNPAIVSESVKKDIETLFPLYNQLSAAHWKTI